MRPLLFALALGVTLAACVPPTNKQTKGDERQDFTVGKRAWKHLNDAQEAVGEKKYDEALSELGEMKERLDRYNLHEQALMWQTYAQIHAAREQLPEAANALSEALKTKALPDAALLETRYNLGQLQLATEHYDEAATTLAGWIAEAKNPTPEAHYIVAIALAQAKRFEEALPQALAAVQAKAEPPEPWMQLLLAIRFELKQMDEVLGLLKVLVVRFPQNKTYWLQLAGVYAEQNDDARSLAVLELMYKQDMLDQPEELRRLAQTYLYRELPVRCIEVIDAELAKGRLPRDVPTLTLLADALTAARDFDRAEATLAEAAAESDDAKLYLSRGRLLFRRERWPQAITALRTAIDKGIDRPGDAWLLIGHAQYNRGDLDGASAAFSRAREDPTTRESANNWLKAIEQQRKQ
ncbi:MAG: tetratricopeptide repeat protein [Myxococcales bacterium]|nr:tetratricopeptide repeat protein [Myxococcales bacterium]